MCNCPPKEHPVAALNHVSAKLAFIADAFAQNTPQPFQLSIQGEFGLFLFLRQMEDEVKAVSDQLFEAEKEVRS